jgi:hypothetical protein
VLYVSVPLPGGAESYLRYRAKNSTRRRS